MKCLVCKKEFTGSKCPRCAFPVVESTDVDYLMASMSEQVRSYRNEFRAAMKLSLPIYRWKAEGSRIVAGEREQLNLGSYQQLCSHVTWLPQKFARIPDTETIKVEVMFTSGNHAEIVEAVLPNLNDASLQSIGIETDDDEMRFRLYLRNDLNNQTASEWIPVP